MKSVKVSRKRRATRPSFDDGFGSDGAEEEGENLEESRAAKKLRREDGQKVVIPVPQSLVQDDNLPLLLRNKDKELQDIKDEKVRLEREISSRPDADESQFQKVHIEDFGAAMLRGMMGGKDPDRMDEKDDSSFAPRPALLGLGATMKPGMNGRKNKRGKEEKGNGQLPGFSWLCNSAVVKVKEGIHEGEFAVVKQADGVPGLNNILLWLDAGSDGKQGELKEEVVKRNLLEMIDHSQLPPNHLGLQLLERALSQSQAMDADSSGEEDSFDPKKSTEKQRKREKAEKRKLKEKHKRDLCWLRSGIKVRVLSKSLENGRLYAQKAVVQDVIDPFNCICTIAMEDGRIVDHVAQEALDTALPKRNGRVMIVRGVHKGEFGTLLDRKASKGIATIQPDGSEESVKLHFEEVAEFVHDEDYEKQNR